MIPDPVQTSQPFWMVLRLQVVWTGGIDMNEKPVSQKKLLAYLKCLCRQCGFTNPRQYKLHTFRHFFASYCAQQNLSYKYVLEWMGHSSSAILDMYFTMNDRASQVAMNSLSFNSEERGNRTILGQSGAHSQKPLL